MTPNDVAGDGNDWKFAATPEPLSPYTSDPKELFGVRGAHVVDASASVDTAWQTTTGRPDVTISVLDSGIKWNDFSAMIDLREKLRLNKGELPVPNHAGSALEPGVDCSTYIGFYDANTDGVFNVLDYACDSRVSANPTNGVGPTYPSDYPVGANQPVLDPQDIIIAFSDGTDADNNGFVDDIAGWDFLDNDNDPYDDVQYGHGTGEAKDSSAEANNEVDITRCCDGSGNPYTASFGDQAGACPNCMFIPLRVGDSFVADAITVTPWAYA